MFTGLLYGGKDEISLPLNKISPLSASSNPAIIFNVVVFPHPLGPSNVKNSFFLMFNERLSKTQLSSKVLETPLISIIFCSKINTSFYRFKMMGEYLSKLL